METGGRFFCPRESWGQEEPSPCLSGGQKNRPPVSPGNQKPPAKIAGGFSAGSHLFDLVRFNHAFVVAAVVVHHREISCVDPYGISIAVSETRLVDEEIV